MHLHTHTSTVSILFCYEVMQHEAKHSNKDVHYANKIFSNLKVIKGKSIYCHSGCSRQEKYFIREEEEKNILDYQSKQNIYKNNRTEKNKIHTRRSVGRRSGSRKILLGSQYVILMKMHENQPSMLLLNTKLSFLHLYTGIFNNFHIEDTRDIPACRKPPLPHVYILPFNFHWNDFHGKLSENVHDFLRE